MTDLRSAAWALTIRLVPQYPVHPLAPYPPLIVNAALTGMVGRRESVPALPVTVDQIVRDAWICHQLGATVLHLHARRDDGSPEWRPEVYAELVTGVRERCPEAVICVSTSGREERQLERRAAVLALNGAAKPDMASLTLGSVDFATGTTVNVPETVDRLAASMRAAGIKPELELFDSGMAHTAHRLIEAGMVEEPAYANLILGAHHAAPATPRELVHLVESLPHGTVWAGAGIGGFQLPINAIAVFAGGHVRTGLEDNVRLGRESEEPATNPRLVERVAALAGIADRELATPAQARSILGLEARHGRGFRIRPARLPRDRGPMLRVLETVNMHRIPSPEMHDFDLGRWYVAEDDGELIGVSGFRLLRKPEGTIGKTTLLAVHPDHREKGVGRALQELRLELMRDEGALRVVTNADRPETIEWYQRNFGYMAVGRTPKLHEFGLVDVDHWTTLEAPLQ